MYTIEQVKRELPEAKIKYNGAMFFGRVSGRFNQFASVSVAYKERKGSIYLMSVFGPILQFSWETVTRCINEDIPLLTD